MYQSTFFVIYVVLQIRLKSAGKADEVGADTKSGASASRGGHGRDKHVEHAKSRGGSERDNNHLLHLEGLFRNCVGGDGDHQPLDNVFNSTFYEFAEIEGCVHYIIPIENIYLSRKYLNILVHTSLYLGMSGFERKNNADGTPNAKYVDVLDEDDSLAGQKFVCMSFLSPDKILQRREQFLFDQFVKEWDFTTSMQKFSDFIQFLSYKYNLKVDNVIGDFNDFCREEETRLKSASTLDAYKNFLDKREDALTAQFQRENEFQTSTRGLKVRGVFTTQEEAELRCKKLREKDPTHDIYVGPVGIWIPWDPDAYKTGRVEFMEEELNQLHQEKMKNEAKAKEEFDRRVKETKRKAIEENIKLAEKSGNVLTQTITEEGNLVGVRETVDFESREVADGEDPLLKTDTDPKI